MKKKQQIKAIGVLGGMGPDASVRLCGQLISLARDKFGVMANVDYPEILLDSVPTPEFYTQSDENRAVVEMLKQRVRQMSNRPLVVLGVACNTAHIFLDELSGETSVPFVSMLDEVVKVVEELGVKRVGLLASPVTFKQKLYQEAFDRTGVKVVVPSVKQIDSLGKCIEDIIRGELKLPGKVLQQIARNLTIRGAEAIILGCTELPLAFPSGFEKPVVDSSEVLALALLREFYRQQPITN